MTESQPEGSETTRDAMQEDLIEESAFEVEETDRYTQKASAKSFTNVIKRKAPASQRKSNKKATEFSWLTKKVEVLLRYIKERKSICDFKGIDFEADLTTIYTEVRKCMARDKPLHFGPLQVSDPKTEIKDMGKG